MRAMVLADGGSPGSWLELRDLPTPVPAAGQVLLRVSACAVCRTDLHVVEGDLPAPKPALVPGHQAVGTVEALGEGVEGIALGERRGVPWLGSACGRCGYCRSCRENLCDQARFTGYQLDGGYAEYAVARADFTLPVPPAYEDVDCAPLLCAGLIGYRALRLAAVEGLDGSGRLGLFGFGSSAHLVIQVALHRGQEVHVYTRGEASRELALELGATSATGGEQLPPVELDSAIIFAPVGELVPLALSCVRKGGIVVCAGIHMTPIPAFEYERLWGERMLRSVANLTRQDGIEFLELAPEVPVRTEAQVFSLEDANEALRLHKSGDLRGSAVLVP